MSARLAGAALLLGVLLFVLLRVLTGALGPLPGAGLSLLAYGAALLALLRAAGAPLAEGLEARSPGRLVLLALAAPVVVVGAMASLALGAASLPPQVILSAGLLAMALAVLEERFWRAALVPRPAPGALAAALALYWAFHAAWLGAEGLRTGLSTALVVLGPLALGGAWTAARLASGALGASVIGHAALKLFLFVEVAARTVGDP